MDEPEKKQDQKKTEDSGSSCDVGSCDCPDGPGCLAIILFIVLMFAVYGVYYVLASMLGYQPVALKDWDKAGALFWVALIACLAVSGYAWWWMEEHWK